MQQRLSAVERALDALDSISRDLAHAARSLAKDRAFTLVCVISLGIGMGACVALATFSRAMTAPARGINSNGLTELLVLPLGPLRAKAGEWALEQWSYPDYQALRDADIGMAITGWTRESSQFGEPTPDQATPPPRVATLYVSANYFRTFGVSLARGPGFDPAIDDTPSAEPRVVLSHDFWTEPGVSRSRHHREIRDDRWHPAYGRRDHAGGLPRPLPPLSSAGFAAVHSAGAASASARESEPSRRPDCRLGATSTAGSTRASTSRRQTRWFRRRSLAWRSDIPRRTNSRRPPSSRTTRRVRPAGRSRKRAFSIILGLAGAVLLIVCLNISGMMLVRGASRERELCIRAALGAGRRRLIQHLFFEAVLLAFAGGALSAFVLFGIPAIVGWWMGAPVPQEIDLDAVGVAISSGLCLLVSVLFGLLPAVRFSRPNLAPALKEDAGGGGRQTIRVHRVAAMVQIGIAIPFLVISGVMLDRVRTAEFGFPTDGLAAARLPAAAGTAREAGFAIRKVRDNLQQASGVRSVAVAEGMPIDFDYRLFRVARADGAEFVTAHVTRVGENFLETVGAPLLSRSNDHRRGPHHGLAGRGDFRTARGATVSGHRADWRTGDGHAGREPRAGVHDRRRECGLRHVTADHRAAADPAAAAGLATEPCSAHRRCISSRAARQATNRSCGPPWRARFAS